MLVVFRLNSKESEFVLSSVEQNQINSEYYMVSLEIHTFKKHEKS